MLSKVRARTAQTQTDGQTHRPARPNALRRLIRG